VKAVKEEYKESEEYKEGRKQGRTCRAVVPRMREKAEGPQAKLEECDVRVTNR
jgi:hypothetical protein